MTDVHKKLAELRRECQAWLKLTSTKQLSPMQVRMVDQMHVELHRLLRKLKLLN